MRVDQIMSRTVFSISPNATVGEAIELIVSRRIHHLLVVNGTVIAGTVSARELSGKDSATALAKVLNPDVRTASPSTPLKEAAKMMVGNTSGCLPVVEAGRIVGIVTTTDLMHVLTREAPRPVTA